MEIATQNKKNLLCPKCSSLNYMHLIIVVLTPALWLFARFAFVFIILTFVNIQMQYVPLLDAVKSQSHTHLHFYCHAHMCVLLFTVSSSKDYIFFPFPCPQKAEKHTSIYSSEIGYIFKAYFAISFEYKRFSLLFTLGIILLVYSEVGATSILKIKKMSKFYFLYSTVTQRERS